MAVVKFSKQTIEPNPLEVDYWVDITSDPYGSIWKYYNGIDWVSLNLNNGSNDGGLSSFDYYTKQQVDSLLSDKADVDSVEGKSDDNFINCKDNYINNPINTKLVINGTDRKDLSVMLFREERKGYTSGRPSVLTDLNRGYRYFDITQKLPIIWNGNRWILGDGFSPFRHSGWGGARPTGTNLDKTEDIGFYFFDRNLGKPIFISSISEEGVITWVDAMGAVVQ